MSDLHPILRPANRREEYDGEDGLQGVQRRRMLATWVVDHGEKSTHLVNRSEYQFAEEQDVPFRMPYGYSKDKRPDLKPFVLSTLCVDRAVPMWGKPEDGDTSDKTLKRTRVTEIAQMLARYGVQPGAYIDIADSALVTADYLAALGETLFMACLPATYSACERVIGEAVAHNQWAKVAHIARTTPTKHRPMASYKVSEGAVTRYGQPYQAVVVHSSSQDQRHP